MSELRLKVGHRPWMQGNVVLPRGVLSGGPLAAVDQVNRREVLDCLPGLAEQGWPHRPE